jgi:prepilin-type processing-associated H-X9-DG protein
VKNNSPKYQVKVLKKTKKDAGVTVFNGSDLICPEDDPPDVLEIDQPGKLPTMYLPMSYGYNIAYIISDAPYDLISKPAEHVTLYDGSMCTNTGKGNAKKNIEGNYDTSLDFAQFAMTMRHLGSGNGVFADAHVASFSTLTDDNVTIDPSVALIDSPFLALFN